MHLGGPMFFLKIHKPIELLAYISNGHSRLNHTLEKLGNISQEFMYYVSMDVWQEYWSPNKGFFKKDNQHIITFGLVLMITTQTWLVFLKIVKVTKLGKLKPLV